MTPLSGVPAVTVAAISVLDHGSAEDLPVLRLQDERSALAKRHGPVKRDSLPVPLGDHLGRADDVGLQDGATGVLAPGNRRVGSKVEAHEQRPTGALAAFMARGGGALRSELAHFLRLTDGREVHREQEYPLRHRRHRRHPRRAATPRPLVGRRGATSPDWDGI